MTKNHILIHKFLEEDLSVEEMDLFRKKFREDKAFASEVRQYTDIFATLKAVDKLKQKYEAYERPKTGFARLMRRPYLIAATFALIITSSLLTYYFLNQQPQTPETLFSLYYTPYTSPRMAVRDESDSIDSKLKEAFASYDEQDFKNAIPYLEEIVSEEPAYALAIFYLGDCYLNVGSYPEAITAFKRVLSVEDKDYDTEARWCLALAYLKAGLLEESRKILQDIVKGEGKHKMKAISLLEDLK